MDPSDGRSFDGQRQSSVRRSLRMSRGAASDDDDYDLSAMLVADGFRPSENIDTSFSIPSQSHTQQPQPPIGSLQSSTSQNPSSTADISKKRSSSIRNRPSSVSKPPRHHDSLTLRNDGTSTAAAQSGVSRMSSISSDSPVIRMESPYRGPSGPSHPYQMYPQRTMSVATTSTTAAAPVPERSYTGPRGPTHPYALYTQNTVPTSETTEPSIPLGFTNVGDNYQRQLGPDGEEAGDLIGPLGHMEELPPYTRYPDNAYVPKPSPSSSDATPVANIAPNSSSEPTIDGAGGIGLATRNPEFSSTDDLGMARTRPSVRSNVSQNSHHDINTAAQDVAEKTPGNKWQRRAKKKLCGIVPYWAICLLVVGMVLMGIIMGAVIGTIFSRHKKPPPQDKDEEYSIQPTPTTVDVEPLSTVPSDLDPIATGWFGLPPLDTSQAPKSCFNDTTQAQAWSCEMPFAYYSMDVEPIPNATSTSNYQLTLTAVNASDSKFFWGTQPPNVLDPVPLKLVNDTFEPSRGPAWWLKMTYNKTVVVSEDNFSSLSKRGWPPHRPGVGMAPPRFKRKSLGAKEGDKPWICTWPDTTLEIFIYPNQNTSMPFPSSTAAPYPSPTWAPEDHSDDDGVFDPLTAYPKVLKMLERRLSDDPDSVATCRQVQIVDGGQGSIDVRDSDGDPVEVVIVENARTWEEQLEQHQRSRYVPKRWYTRALLARDSLELTDCGCLWWST